MDKNSKLRRYRRKDYTQLVSFPVEIVGRDGIVRRYSFEESIRLYQRRIASASTRYTDTEVAIAEMRHCRLRIDQLRRSYFARYGWAELSCARDGVGDFAGEVAAFLRRCLDSVDTEPERYGLSSVGEDAAQQIFYVYPRDTQAGQPSYLLYFHAFSEDGDDQGRDTFFSFLKALQSVSNSSTAETLVAFHYSADCGLILTGKGDDIKRSAIIGVQDEYPLILETPPTDPLLQGLVLLQRGDQDGALRQFSKAYEANNYRRGAYIGAASIAEQLGRYAHAEMTALMGCHYFPQDPFLHFLLAVVRLRQGNGEGAAAALDGINTEPAISKYARNIVDGLISLNLGRMRQGQKQILTATPPSSDALLCATQRWVKAQLAARTVLQGSAAALTAIFMLLAVTINLWLVLPAIGTAALIPAIHAAWRRQFQRLLGLRAAHGLLLVEPDALQAINRVQKLVT